MDNSIIKDIVFKRVEDTNEEYHSHDSISASGLKKMKKSPAHYRYEDRTETEAMRFGSMYHTYILEPEKFEKEYTIVNPADRPDLRYSMTAKANAAWLEEFRNPVFPEMIAQLRAMKQVLWRHPYARSLLTNGETEVSYYCELDIGNEKPVNVRIRPDMIKHNKRIIVDLKTAQDASRDEFPRAAARYDYQIQAAFYADMLELITGNDLGYRFFFIAQEKTPPYAFNIFQASPQFMSIGKYEYEILLMLYAWCIENNKWPGYQVFCQNEYGVLDLTLPPYAIKEMEYFLHDYLKRR